jgi:hypothetical protein
MVREPNVPCKSNKDWSLVDLEGLPQDVVPRTNYQVSASREEFEKGVPGWSGVPSTKYWRLAWRNMTQPGLERSLHAAVIPPRSTHVHTIYSLAVFGGEAQDIREPVEDARSTLILAGLWASLPYDYLVKVSAGNVRAELIDRFPAPIEHPLVSEMLHRILRLTCLTRKYAPLWEGIDSGSEKKIVWTSAFNKYIRSEAGGSLSWTGETPLRTDLARRAALVEIDALVALMLDLSSDQLGLIFRSQFPVLRKYENEMYFDARGRKIAKDHHARGVRQRKTDYKDLESWMNGEDYGDLLDRYTPFAPDDGHDEPWFYKPDREAEMRIAYADFNQILSGA